MSKSAVDATRFTATSPHAYSKPSPSRSAANISMPASSSQIPPRVQSSQKPGRSGHSRPVGPTPNPPPSSSATTETPQQKVARLRAARLAARAAEFSTWDRVVIRGRIWADRAHKFTALSLIGLTVVCGGVTAFALSDMIMHNRRKRTAFYNEQHLMYTQRLLAAIETEKAGLPLTDDQRLVLNRERAKVQADEVRKEASWGRAVKNVFVGGLKMDMDGPARARNDGQQERDAMQAAGFAKGVIPSEAEILERIGVDKLKLLEKSEGKAIDAALLSDGNSNSTQTALSERTIKSVKAGPLDTMAENAALKVRDTGGGWFHWSSKKAS